MSGERGDETDRDDLTQQRVRSLLSGAPPEPMPDDVVARLDAALRSEATRRTEAADEAAGATEVTDKPRVRRWIASTAVAAVFLVVLMVALGQVLSGGTDSSSVSGSSAETGERAQGEVEDPGAPPSAEGKALSPSTTGRVRLSSTGLEADITSKVVQPGRTLPAAPDLAALRCADGRLVTAAGLAVTVDGRPARLFASGPATQREFRAIGCVGQTPQVIAATTIDVRSATAG